MGMVVLAYHFIEKSVHKDMPHSVLVNVIEQTGDGGRVNGFAVFHS